MWCRFTYLISVSLLQSTLRELSVLHDLDRIYWWLDIEPGSDPALFDVLVEVAGLTFVYSYVRKYLTATHVNSMKARLLFPDNKGSFKYTMPPAQSPNLCGSLTVTLDTRLSQPAANQAVTKVHE